MEVEINPEVDISNDLKDNESSGSVINKAAIIHHLVNDDKITFKNQQRGESDLNEKEKAKIAGDIFDKSKMNFLTRFGKHLLSQHLEYFKRFAADNDEGFEVALLLRQLSRMKTKKINVDRKNRRFQALKLMVQENSYFSELEMMKRNPLLYEQLVGQYMSEAERKDRDKFDKDTITFVKLLMEGMERDQADNKRKIQKENEENAMEEEDSDEEDDAPGPAFVEPKPSTSKWGEIPGFEKEEPIRRYAAYTAPQKFITSEERQLLRNEFVTLMYQNFLDGNDEEFDYDSVDYNDFYDNLDIVNHDAEDRYFDEEEPETAKDAPPAAESSEDELDIYMNALNQHPSVCQLSADLKKL